MRIGNPLILIDDEAMFVFHGKTILKQKL